MFLERKALTPGSDNEAVFLWFVEFLPELLPSDTPRTTLNNFEKQVREADIRAAKKAAKHPSKRIFKICLNLIQFSCVSFF
jgi:hypothetical protein